MSISEFINQNYDVVFKSDKIDSLEDAEEFLLGECHYTTDRKIHDLFINTFGENSVVFFEGHKLLKKLDPSCLRREGINVNKIAAFGWDYLLDGKDQRIEPDNLFDSEEADELEYEIRQIENEKLTLLGQNADKNKIIAVDLRLHQAKEKLQLVFDNIFDKIRSYYAFRSTSLNEALDKARTLEIGFNIKRTFLIAGAAHLKRATTGLDETKIDQNAFYSFLNNRKAVILFPKNSPKDF